MPPAMAVMTDAPTVWNFSQFIQRVSLTDANVAPHVEYEGLTIVGAVTSESKDYITSQGVHFNGATKAGSRYIQVTLDRAGELAVSFTSNGSSARTCYIALSVPANSYVASANAVHDTVVAQLLPETYYIGIEGGITITSITFTPV